MIQVVLNKENKKCGIWQFAEGLHWDLYSIEKLNDLASTEKVLVHFEYSFEDYAILQYLNRDNIIIWMHTFIDKKEYNEINKYIIENSKYTIIATKPRKWETVESDKFIFIPFPCNNIVNIKREYNNKEQLQLVRFGFPFPHIDVEEICYLIYKDISKQFDVNFMAPFSTALPLARHLTVDFHNYIISLNNIHGYNIKVDRTFYERIELINKLDNYDIIIEPNYPLKKEVYYSSSKLATAAEINIPFVITDKRRFRAFPEHWYIKCDRFSLYDKLIELFKSGNIEQERKFVPLWNNLTNKKEEIESYIEGLFYD